MKKRYFVFIGIVIVFCILFTIYVLNYKNIIKNTNFVKLQNLEESSIDFSPYSNQGSLKILVTAKNSTKGIDKLEYFSSTGEKQEIFAHGKDTVAVDYEIMVNGNYEFKLTDTAGNSISKSLIVDDDYRENLIKINISSTEPLGTEVSVNIDYSNTMHKSYYYKIGDNSNNWVKYTGEFKITSYDVLAKNLQSNNNAVTLYAKSTDSSNNIIISKSIINLDLDMPSKPNINIISTDDYYTMTLDGSVLYSNISINYDNRSDITNYYSTDGGKNWIEYSVNSIISVKNRHIEAKSVKKVSGLECINSIDINPIPADRNHAMGANVFDNDVNTYQEYPSSYGVLKLDPSIANEKLEIVTDIYDNEWKGWLKLFDSDNNVVYEGRPSNGKNTITVVAGAVKLIYYPYNPFNHLDKLCEIQLVNEPKLTITHNYPKITNSGIEQFYDVVNSITYLNCKEKYYKINNGEWKSYNNEPIKLNLGDTIYAKGINYLDNETRMAQYKATLPRDAIGPLAYDNNTSTSFTTTSSAYILLDSNIVNKKLSVVIELIWYEYKCTLKLLDSGGNVLYSKAASTGTHNITVLEGSYKLVFSPYNPFGHLDLLREIKLIN